VVGCGEIARVHIPYIRSYRGAEIVGVCDSNLAQAQSLAQQFEIPEVYHDLMTLLSRQKPDVVHIVTPPQTHAALAIAVMEAGGHVLVEKPMAVSLEEADRMMATAQRMGVQLCVDHNRLFDPVMLQAKQMVARGELGDIVGVEAFQGFSRLTMAPAQTHWSLHLPGGILQDIAPHSISFIPVFMREPQPVSVAIKRTGLLPGTPFEEARVLFEGEKALGQLTFSLSSQPTMNFLKLYGTEASLHIDFNTITLVVYRNYRLPKLLAKSWVNIDQGLQLLGSTVRNSMQVLMGKMRYFPGMEHVIHTYYDSLENGSAPPVTAAEGRDVVRVLEFICQRAARSAAASEKRPEADRVT
jgi:predicted dehydrogenase